MATSRSITRSLPLDFAVPRQSGFLATLALATAFAAVAPMAFAQTPPPPAPPHPAGHETSTAPVAKPSEAAKPPAAPEPKPAEEAALPHSAAELSDAAGNVIGSVRIADTPSGELHVIADLKGLPPGGTHAIHIHEFGKCEPPKFESAGGHLAGGKEHGALHPGGQHQGDMPNLTVAADGTAKVEYFSSGVKVADVTDADGGAVVVHAKADDYMSQPAGAAGDRIACGVFSAAK